MRKFIVAIDPSGNFENGQGGTGVAYYSETPSGKTFFHETVWAKNYVSKAEYYKAIENCIESFVLTISQDQTLVVIEDFRIQAGNAKKTSNQTMETSELIGRLESKLDDMGVKHKRQQNVVKSRWPNQLLIKELTEMGFDTPKFKSPHERDATRHLLQAIFWTFKKEIK